jgi:uncharacterized protein with PQ loop repeat
MNLAVEALGMVAGGFVTCAAMPRVLNILREPERALGESIPRNAMLVAGNLLWVVYGCVAPAPVIALMCAVAGVLNGLILAAAIRAARGASP